jgi:small subunit ribosomal protein S16
MKRLGRKHRPFYRVCVMDSRTPRNGRAIEEVGTYDTTIREKAARVNLNLERIDYWLSVGAQPSEKVAALIKKVRTNDFGTVKEPPPMQAPKQPEPEAPPAEEAAESPAGEAPAEESAE